MKKLDKFIYDYNHIGKVFLRVRKRLKLSQRKFAKQLSITSTHLSLIEHGKQVPSLKLITTLAQWCTDNDL